MKQSLPLKNYLLLLLTAAIWGFAFVAQKDGMNYVGPFTYNGVRCLLGCVTLLPIISLSKHRKGAPLRGKKLFWGGLFCGLALFAGSMLQQYGIALQSADTNVGKAGFITACYCVFVPVLSVLFLRKKQAAAVWGGCGLAVVGFFFLCLVPGLTRGEGLQAEGSDLLLLLCAIAFAVQILVIDHYTPLVDGVCMSCLQFFVCGVLCLMGAFIWEHPTIKNILSGWLPILYAGVLSCGVAYTLQIVGQKNVNPSGAALILSLESVFSVLGGFFFQHTGMSGWELLGCALVFFAVLLVNLAPSHRP